MSEEKKEYWITPPEIYEALDREFQFDFDPCPYPLPEGYNGLEVDWGECVYLNPPFRKTDGKHGTGPTAFIRKAIEENKKGKTVVVMINTNAFINMLISAGAEMRSMGRVKWLDGRTREPWKSPSNTTCFILRGPKHTRPPQPIGEEELKDIGIDLIDEFFPKGECKERGKAIVLYATLIIEFQKYLAARLPKPIEGVVEALRLILPMAKGYAHQHNVGSNQEYVNTAEQALLNYRTHINQGTN